MASVRRPGHPGLILLLACVAQFMVILDVSVVNVALPSIQSGLDFTEANLQWVVSAYAVPFAGFLLLGGRSGDLLGRKRMFLVGVAVFSLASLLGALSATEAQLIASRALQGLGGAIVAPATLSIITTTFKEGPERNRALGLWGAVGARRRHRGGARRRAAHRPAELALDLPHQRADRAAAPAVLLAVHPGEQGRPSSTAASMPRARCRSRSGSARSCSGS